MPTPLDCRACPRLANLAKQLGDGPFFFGAKPMYCDFAMFHVLDNTRTLEPAALDAHPNVVAFMDAVAKLPGVAEYLAERPDCVDIGTAPMLKPK